MILDLVDEATGDAHVLYIPCLYSQTDSSDMDKCTELQVDR